MCNNIHKSCKNDEENKNSNFAPTLTLSITTSRHKRCSSSSSARSSPGIVALTWEPSRTLSSSTVMRRIKRSIGTWIMTPTDFSFADSLHKSARYCRETRASSGSSKCSSSVGFGAGKSWSLVRYLAPAYCTVCVLHQISQSSGASSDACWWTRVDDN